MKRRHFLKSSAILAAGMTMPAFARASVLGASDRINVALIGCNSMGWIDLSDFLAHPNVHCTALCDIDANVLARRAAELKERHGQTAKTCSDYRKMLEQRDIDVVIIGTPDHWHCLPFIEACRAGKDVYVEKPLANTIAECDAMTATATRYNRIVQVGQQQRSGKIWHSLMDYLKTGELGRIGRVKIFANFSYAAIAEPAPDTTAPDGVDYDFWLGPTPARPFNPHRFHGLWRMYWNYGGGLLTDWGVHLLDMCLWAKDIKEMPREIIATGGKFLYPDGAHETPDTLSVQYRFDDFVMEWENNAGSDSGPYYGRNYGLLFEGVNGRLVANRESWEVFPHGEKTSALKNEEPDNSHRAHVTNFLECIRTRNPQTACTIQNAGLCAKYAHAGNISARTDRPLTYDDAARTFNNAEADRLLRPDYRGEWKKYQTEYKI
jgi:predicted dehydrogenase